MEKYLLNNGNRLVITQDEDPSDPREWDNVWNICVREHRHYKFPNELDYDFDSAAEDAEKFWPLYNELEQKVREVGHERGKAKAEMYRLLQPFHTNYPGKGTEPAGVSQGRTKAGDHRAQAQPVILDEHPKGSPAPVDKLLEEYILTFEKETRLRSEYHRMFLKVLTAEQVARLYIAEERFSNKLFRDYIDRKLEQKDK